MTLLFKLLWLTLHGIACAMHLLAEWACEVTAERVKGGHGGDGEDEEPQ